MSEEWFPRLEESKSDSLPSEEEQQLMTLDEFEEICRVFPNEVSPNIVEKETAKARVKEILNIPKKIQKWWRRR